MFGRATITLGIGPRSSFKLCYALLTPNQGFILKAFQNQFVSICFKPLVKVRGNPGNGVSGPPKIAGERPQAPHSR